MIMDLQAILTAAEECGAGAVMKAFEDLKRHNQDLAQEVYTACDAYFANVEQGQARIMQRITELLQQREDLEKRIKAMQPALVSATVSGESEAFSRVQGALTDLEAEKASIGTQIEILTSTAIPGDKALFAACQEKKTALDADNVQLQEVDRLIHDLAKQQHSLWKKLYDGTCVWGRIPGSSVSRYDKVYNHFHTSGVRQDTTAPQVEPC